jgi:hypothetical protein
MWFVLDRLKGKLNPIIVLLIIVLFLVVPIWNLGGFRFWTAAHVFTYGCLHYIYKYKPKRVLWAILTPFVFHFAFLLPTALLLFHMVSGSRLKLYYFFFLLSFLVSEINIELINTNIESNAPEILQQKTEAYRSESALKNFEKSKVETTKVWYAAYQGKFLSWPIFLILAIGYWKFKAFIKENKQLTTVFSFSYLFLGVSNIMVNLPSGGRYRSVALLFALSALIIFFQNKSSDKSILHILKISSPLLILFVIVSIRESFYFMSLMTIIGNPFFAIFTFGENISLNDIIK